MVTQALNQLLSPKKRLSLILIFAVLASVIYLMLGHARTSSAATGCTALPTTKGAVTVSSVSIPSTGTYHVWSRIKTADTTNNSFLFQTDNNCNINIGDSATIPANTWTWVDYRDGNSATKADVSLSAGTHPMELAGREDNVSLDRILLISDTCVPTGTGDNCVIASDITPPTVSLTAPAAGTTVSGSSVAVSANASDDTGVVGVQFKIDGNNLNSEDVSSPYATTWDTTTVANGSHTLTATARDIAGHSTTSTAVAITVDNGTILTIGETTITAGNDSGNANLLIAQQATLGQSATIQSLSFYVVNAAGKLRLGIYDATGPSGGPGAKKAETAEITPVAGWNTANVTSQVSLPAGSYWLAYLPSDNNLSFKNSSTTTTPSRFYTFTYGTMPATFSTTTSTTTSHWSLYATLSIASAGPKQGDINGDNSVNITDLSLLLSSYNQNTTQCTTNTAFKCDLSSPGDGVVNIFDLSILLSHYGT
jgi:hypothetical protein